MPKAKKVKLSASLKSVLLPSKGKESKKPKPKQQPPYSTTKSLTTKNLTTNKQQTTGPKYSFPYTARDYILLVGEGKKTSSIITKNYPNKYSII